MFPVNIANIFLTEQLRGQKNNTLDSGNAGDKKIFTWAAAKKIFLLI